MTPDQARRLLRPKAAGMYTTEQLMEKTLRDVKAMSPEQKLEVRHMLDKAFPPKI